jgi:hypothetical protein
LAAKDAKKTASKPAQPNEEQSETITLKSHDANSDENKFFYIGRLNDAKPLRAVGIRSGYLILRPTEYYTQYPSDQEWTGPELKWENITLTKRKFPKARKHDSVGYKKALVKELTKEEVHGELPGSAVEAENVLKENETNKHLPGSQAEAENPSEEDFEWVDVRQEIKVGRDKNKQEVWAFLSKNQVVNLSSFTKPDYKRIAAENVVFHKEFLKKGIPTQELIKQALSQNAEED